MKCAWIENFIVVEIDGYTRPCCLEPSKEARLANINDGILNAWNDKKLIKLRQELAENGFNENTRPYCRRCEIVENLNQPSVRTNTKFYSEDRELKVLQFKMSNRCQLACAHCHPSISTGWAKLLEIKPLVVEGLQVTDTFLKELTDILPQLSCIKFTGGEPFLDPGHWKILEHLHRYDRSHCDLEYITNGITSFKPHLWEGWKTVKCGISVDGYQDTYEWFRRGSTWREICAGVENIKQFADVSMLYAITPFTFHDYHKAKVFWGNLNPIRVVFPKYASMIDFPMEIASQVESYKTIPYVSFAQGDNIDIYRDFANWWDTKWNTDGWATKLFWWLK